MKKFLFLCLLLAGIYVAGNYIVFYSSFFINLDSNRPVTTFARTQGKDIMVDSGNGFQKFEIRGVDMGIGIPGHFATDFAIDEGTYLRWFEYIQAMGANTIRVYTILHDDFYNAFYAYNQNNPEPLYLLQGLWVSDYAQNSHIDAWEDEFFGNLVADSKVMIDVLHGNRKVPVGRLYGSGNYRHDVSPWVIGYILGVEWEDVTVAYTDDIAAERAGYKGEYMYTTPAASSFETMLAAFGDQVIAYETERYQQQRLMAFANWATTDPFDYEPVIQQYFMKCAKVDVEHLQTTAEFISGCFASYHIYPYHPDYLRYAENLEEILRDTGMSDSYGAYLALLNRHHSIPVVISEFGVPTSRGMAQKEQAGSRSQGRMSEKQQGAAIISMYEQIKQAGCAGCCIFSWQDEWFKRTWNTMHAVDLTKTPYWSDYQTNEQYFGLLSFDPGDERSICYVDGDLSEWTAEDVLIEGTDAILSWKYDEKFVYFLVYKKGFQNGSEVLYLPLDITPKSGSSYCRNYDVDFEREADFVVCVDGKDNTRVLVQERYEVLRAMYYMDTHGRDPYELPPDRQSPVFKPINLILQTATRLLSGDETAKAEVYETGRLTYGNANPAAPDFNSLADFYFTGDYVEMKLPWQLLNFSNPAEMVIHDDYYEHYGIENLKIDQMYVGLGAERNKNFTIKMKAAALQGWKNKPIYHERLKSAYYEVQKVWGNL